jgi:hypothetical protein
MKEVDHEDVKSLLKQSLRPASMESERDLWPQMLRRLDERSPAPIPWLDWALLALVVICALAFPGSIPVLLYHL